MSTSNSDLKYRNILVPVQKTRSSMMPSFCNTLCGGDSDGAIKPSLKYVPCLDTEDLPSPGSATSVVAGGLAICIAVDPKGTLYALGDKCPPVNQPLSFGKVNADGTIEDPVLGTKFSLKTGEVVSWCPSGIGKLIGGLFEPAGVPTYPVKKSGSKIEVQVDVNYKANFESQYWAGILDAKGKANGKYY